MTMPSKVTGWKLKGGSVYFYDPDPEWLAKQSPGEIDVIHLICADIAEELARALEACRNALLNVYHSEFDGVFTDDDFKDISEPYDTVLSHFYSEVDEINP